LTCEILEKYRLNWKQKNHLVIDQFCLPMNITSRALVANMSKILTLMGFQA
jgi:hypothetical protein